MSAPVPAPTFKRDPVCGMNVDPATTKHVHELAGENYYFCCAGCREKFKSDPQKYLKSAPGLVALGMPAAPKIVPVLSHDHEQASPNSIGPAYVCPMCPEVHEKKPGACPSCGMALERDTPCLCRDAPNTPARCIPRSCAQRRDHAQSAAWLSNPVRRARRTRRIQNCAA